MQPSLHSFQPTYHLDVHLQPDENIFEFVQRRFALHHGARIQTLLPWQCTLSDEQGTLLASAGLNVSVQRGGVDIINSAGMG